MLRSGNRARLLCPRRLHDSVGLALCVSLLGSGPNWGADGEPAYALHINQYIRWQPDTWRRWRLRWRLRPSCRARAWPTLSPGANGGGRAQRGRPRAGADLPRVPPYSGAPLPSN
jgi:hypothetical protein